MEILVGVCGFPTSKQKIYTTLDVVELQETFYNLPDPEKMKNLREEAPAYFHFTAKVFQGVTHSSNSPTFKKTKGFIPTERHGLLRPTKENLALWEHFVERIKPLRPDLLVIQTPPSLKPSSHIYEFFTAVVGKWRLAWEPRGETLRDTKLIEKVADIGVVIITDPLKRRPWGVDFFYFRLHGLGDKEINYKYKYTTEDIIRLYEILQNLRGFVYVLFNNIYMYQDAVALRELTRKNLKSPR
ncbi:MAG: DUF72 domain-containing protein [Pyrobaculum sp.]